MSSPRVEKLARRHDVEGFDCGNDDLNRFLVRYALQNQFAGSSTTYVGLVQDEIVGFHTLVYGSVEHEAAPARVAKGLAKHPIPLMVLARLGVSLRSQGKGVGAGLLKDAVLRTLQAADIAGLRGLAAHAKDDGAKAFYERYGFESSPTDPYHMIVLLKDIRGALGVL
jgi:GNAT superfamily N-acetyltransferase